MKVTCSNEMVQRIVNEFYDEFIETYGEEYSNLIIAQLEKACSQVKEVKSFDGNIATAQKEMGIRYTKNSFMNFSAILKHEFWHVISYSARENGERPATTKHFPKRYKEAILKTNYPQLLYKRELEELRETFKHNPEYLKIALERNTYEHFTEIMNVSLVEENEKWTEWFANRTHKRDMKDYFLDFDDGFFMKRYSSGSSYSSFLFMADMLSVLVPEDKLFEMYVGEPNGDKPRFTYNDMLEELDATYEDALTQQEKEEYKYFYLKLLVDEKEIYTNSKSDKNKTRLYIQSSLATFLRAYLIKLNNIQKSGNIDFKQLQDIYSEIKFMQSQMLWNIDVEQMEGLEYIQELEKIQNKFIELSVVLKDEHEETREMVDSIDYRQNNPYEISQIGKQSIDGILASEATGEERKIRIGKYILKTNKAGIKESLYATLKTVLGEEIYKYLLEEYKAEAIQKNKDVFVAFYMIENINSAEDVVKAYEYMYSLYAKTLAEIPENENTYNLLSSNVRMIENLQNYTLFNSSTGKVINGLRNVRMIYERKFESFNGYINDVLEEKVGKRRNSTWCQDARKIQYELQLKISGEVEI